jgi:hypothetical protein
LVKKVDFDLKTSIIVCILTKTGRSVFMYKVYQIKLADEVTDYVNSNGRGHAGGEEKYPIYETYMRLNHSIRDENKMNDTDFQHYTNVCVVKKDAGLVDSDGNSWLVDCLEGVFAVLNGRYFDEDTGEDLVHESHVSGYSMKTITRKDGEVVTYRDMRSLSVGDIVEDCDNGTFHIVASYGFQDVTSKVKNYVETTAEVA